MDKTDSMSFATTKSLLLGCYEDFLRNFNPGERRKIIEELYDLTIGIFSIQSKNLDEANEKVMRYLRGKYPVHGQLFGMTVTPEERKEMREIAKNPSGHPGGLTLKSSTTIQASREESEQCILRRKFD